MTKVNWVPGRERQVLVLTVSEAHGGEAAVKAGCVRDPRALGALRPWTPSLRCAEEARVRAVAPAAFDHFRGNLNLVGHLGQQTSLQAAKSHVLCLS